MIYIVLLLAGTALLAFAFGLLGNIPPTPDWLENVSNGFTTILTHISYIMAWILTAEIFFGTIVILAAVFAFEPIYHGTMWVLKKIPVLNIK